MPRAVLALLMLVALPLWAAQPKDLTWSEMIPPDAPKEVPNMTPLHDLSQMSSTLSAESAPAAVTAATDIHTKARKSHYNLNCAKSRLVPPGRMSCR